MIYNCTLDPFLFNHDTLELNYLSAEVSTSRRVEDAEFSHARARESARIWVSGRLLQVATAL